jgi:CRISPR system Cascade subunit CasD
MQSWGTRSRFDDRDTERMPSKSGVIGLLCAALGWHRDTPEEEIKRLVALKMAVRADRPGVLEVDFHTALDVLKADGKSRGTVVSRRHYLSDAIFLVALEGDLVGLSEVHEALAAPHWPLYLGRKSFPPGGSVFISDGLRPGESRLVALRSYPWLAARRRLPLLETRELQETGLEIEDECEAGEEGFLRSDVPLSLADRTFRTRRVLRREPVSLDDLRQEAEDVSESAAH